MTVGVTRSGSFQQQLQSGNENNTKSYSPN